MPPSGRNQWESLPHSENGILGSIHGQYIAAALGTLGHATRRRVSAEEARGTGASHITSGRRTGLKLKSPLLIRGM